jgi:curved DNA-binding protein CbpA
MPKITNIENFQGWLSLVNPRDVEDNQFEELTNMFYNADKRIQSRRWVDFFGNELPNGKPVTSLFFFQNDETAERILLATWWEEIYKYNEWTSDYDELKTWLTEFETDWVTRTRWSFAVYRNEVYMCNWVDNYQKLVSPYGSWNFTEYATQPKCRYLEYMQDSIFWAWDDSNPSTLYYTTAAAADANTINTNVVVVWWDELWRINWIKELWQIILAWKNKKIYSINVASETALPIDSQNGLYSHRATERVWGSLSYFNDTWYDFLKQRSGVTWSQWLDSESKTNDLRALVDKITPNSYNYSFSEYILALTNLYWTFDTWDDKRPDTTLVWSSLVWAWSQYILPNSNDSAQYIDEDWVRHYLIASATEWRVYEIENWFTDFDQAIPHSLTTKEWDLWDITRFKTFSYVDIIWLKNEWWEINVDILVWWEISWSSIIDDDYINKDSSVLTIWTRPIWTYVLWGWTWLEEVDLFQYKIRIPLYDTDTTIQVKMNSEAAWMVWTLEKMAVSSEQESWDLFEYSLIG